MSVTFGTMQGYALTLDKFLRHAAKWHPDAEVVTAVGDNAYQRIGYAALMARSLKISALLAERGVKAGDAVATLAWNTQAHVECWYAVMGMGAVCHTLNPRLTAAQLSTMLNQSGARILIASADLLQQAMQISERAGALEAVLVIDGAAAEASGERPNVTALESVIEATPGSYEWGQFDETSPSGLCFTSGTTGAPKGVTYTHRSSYLHTLRLLQADGMAISGSESVLAVVPMFHANAWGLPFALPAAGGKLVLPGRRTDGESLANLIAAEHVTLGVGVPTVWLGLVEHLEATGGQLPSLRRIIVGGSPIAPALMARIENRLNVIVQTSWGMTELSPLGTITPAMQDVRSAASAGRPAIGLDLLLTDADGAALPSQREAEGHLRVRGPAVVASYLGESESAADADGWFPTGDLARIDAMGNLQITGRAKDLIKSGGEWINPAEIEAVVGGLPEVSLAAVIGRPDPKWGERPILLIELRDQNEISDDQLLNGLRGRVAPWWFPDEIVRLSAMPLAPTGKIDKIRLRAEYGAA